MTNQTGEERELSPTRRVLAGAKGAAGRTAAVTGLLAVGLTWILAGPEDTWVAKIGLGATVWSASLVLPLYLMGSDENARAFSELKALREQVNDSALSLPASQSRQEFDASMAKYSDYVKALRDKHPMPVTAISYIGRDGEGQGNAPVIIETRRGYRYSVWKGHSVGFFSVSKIAGG